MLRADTLLQRLEVEAAAYADAALRTPRDRSEWGYGQAAGHYTGLLRAREIVSQMLEEEENAT